MKVLTFNLDLNQQLSYKPKKPFYVLMPAYNEAGHPYFVDTIIKTTKIEGLEKLIVIDDGSTDDTAEQVRSLASNNNSINLISYKKRLGKEGAIKAGLNYLINSKFNGDSWVVLMDSDGQHKPEDIQRMLYVAETTNADLVSGCRSYSLMPFSRRIANYGMHLLLKYEWKVPLKDVQCGFKVFKGKWAKLFGLLLNNNGGYKIEISLIYNLIKHNAKLLCEVPIRTEYKNCSRKSGMGLLNKNWMAQTFYALNKGSELRNLDFLNWVSSWKIWKL